MRASAGSHRTFLYVRVSTYDQAEYGTSLDGQRDLGVKFCAEQGYADPQVRVEVESAGEEKVIDDECRVYQSYSIDGRPSRPFGYYACS